MQCDTTRTKGWERPNLVHNAIKALSKDKIRLLFFVVPTNWDIIINTTI
jgi:hypothetical protein